MSSWAVSGFAAFLVIGIGALLVWIPAVGRRGLLFGVWVGTEASSGERAEALRRRWTRGVAAVTVAVLAGVLVLSRSETGVLWLTPATLVQVAACGWLYVRLHRDASRLAPEGEPPGAPEVSVSPGRGSVVPLIAAGLVVAAAGGIFAYHLAHLEELPQRIPVHFDLSGNADRWAERSPWTFVALPGFMAVLGVFLAGMAWLVAHARLSLRGGRGTAASAEAQRRFRSAVSHFLSGMAIVTGVLFAGMSRFQFESARGEGPAPVWQPLALIGVVMLYSLVGVIWLFARYGQGGSRLEGSSDDAPLTDGLADNRHWKLGALYVNRDDPALLVEKRFGLGYTVNLGNPKAILFFVALFAAMALLVVIAVASS